MNEAAAHRVKMFALGAGLLAGSGVLAARPHIPQIEERIFHAINRVSSKPALGIKAVMQLGTFGTVPVVAAISYRAGRKELAARLALGGTAAWLGAKAVKRTVERGRPAALHRVEKMRGDHGGDFGWISGHTAVATTLACIFAPVIPRPARPALAALAAAVGLGRIYVGAHEPLDVVGGAGFGLMVGSLFRQGRKTGAAA